MMQPYVKIYLDYFDYKTQNEVVCEACQGQAVEVHHIHGRDEGKDVIGNLMAVCRKCHDRATSSKNFVKAEDMQLIHNFFLAGARNRFLI